MAVTIFNSYSIVNNLVKDIVLKNNIFLGLDILNLFLLLIGLILNLVYYVFIYLPRKINFSGFSWQGIQAMIRQGRKDLIQSLPDFLDFWLDYWQTTQRKLRILIRKTEQLSEQINQLILEQGLSSPLKIAQQHFQKLKDYEKWGKYWSMAGLFYAIVIYPSLSWVYLTIASLFFLDLYFPLCLNFKGKRKYLKLYKKIHLDSLVPLGVLGLLIFGLVTVDWHGQKSIFFAFFFLLYGSLFIHFSDYRRRRVRTAEQGHHAQQKVKLYLLEHNYRISHYDLDIIDEQGNEKGDIDLVIRHHQLPFVLEVKHFVGTVYIRQEEIKGILQPMLRRRSRTIRRGRRNRNRNHQPFPGFGRETCPATKFLADAQWFQREWCLKREPICIFVFTHEKVVLDLPQQYQRKRFFYFNGAWFVRLNQLDSLLQSLSSQKL
jgi:hypothetical protein